MDDTSATQDAPTTTLTDDKVTSVFAGKVVRKDLVRKVKVGANVPVFVLEYLLGKYCASSDPDGHPDAGLGVVQDHARHQPTSGPDEATKVAEPRHQEGGPATRSSTRSRFATSSDERQVLGRGRQLRPPKYVRVPDRYVRDFDRLLTGGIWAQVDMAHQYDEEARGRALARSVIDRS